MKKLIIIGLLIAAPSLAVDDVFSKYRKQALGSWGDYVYRLENNDVKCYAFVATGGGIAMQCKWKAEKNEKSTKKTNVQN